jgi:hypothetical protein
MMAWLEQQEGPLVVYSSDQALSLGVRYQARQSIAHDGKDGGWWVYSGNEAGLQEWFSREKRLQLIGEDSVQYGAEIGADFVIVPSAEARTLQDLKPVYESDFYKAFDVRLFS